MIFNKYIFKTQFLKRISFKIVKNKFFFINLNNSIPKKNVY